MSELDIATERLDEQALEAVDDVGELSLEDVALRGIVTARTHTESAAANADPIHHPQEQEDEIRRPPRQKPGRTKGTANPDDNVDLYLSDIGNVPLLTAAKERELAQTIEAGKAAAARLDNPDESFTSREARELRRAARAGEEAKGSFIRANLRLVVSLARRYPDLVGMELLDRIQEGNLGLDHAVDKFDWRKGFKFSTYATFWIRQAIGRGMDKKGRTIRISSEPAEELRAALRHAAQAGEDLDSDMEELYRLSTPTSLQAPRGDEDDRTLEDKLADPEAEAPDEVLIAQEADDDLTGLVNILDARARSAIEMRFGLGDGKKRSYREVGEQLGLNADAARRLCLRAIGALREEAQSRNLEFDY